MSANYDDGRLIGEQWVRGVAFSGESPEHYSRLMAEADVFQGQPPAPHGWAGVVYYALHPTERGERDRSEVADFWFDVLGPEQTRRVADKDFLRGFVDGVAALWRNLPDLPADGVASLWRETKDIPAKIRALEEAGEIERGSIEVTSLPK